MHLPAVVHLMEGQVQQDVPRPVVAQAGAALEADPALEARGVPRA